MRESKEQTNKLNLEEQESPQPGLNRRQFIGAGTAVAAALILPKSAQADTRTPKSVMKIAQASTSCTPPSLTNPSDTSFVQPDVITSAQLNPSDNYCTLTRTLNVVGKPYSDVNDPTTLVRAFQDPQARTQTPALYPGPTLCVNPGDSIELTINNNLNQANNGQGINPNSCPGTLNTPNCFDDINMHFHGLHVSPISVGTDDQGNTVYLSSADPRVKTKKNENGTVILTKSSDDVLYDLEPGHSHLYCPWLPAFHAPGTHWYHSHRHGSTAIEVAGGMVGTLIVKEPPGQEICPGVPDVVMLIQEEPQSGSNGTTPQDKLDQGIYTRPGNSASGTFRVNGIGVNKNNKPSTLTLQNGEIQRWRIINANSTPRAFMNLELRENNADGSPNQNGALQTLYRVAVDGITLYGKSMNDPSVNLTQVPFSPGNRVDLLVKLEPETTTYTLWKVIDSNLVSRQMASNSPPEPLVSINVDGNTTFANAAQVQTSFTNLINDGIPTAGKPAYLDPIATVDKENTTPVAFQAAPGNFTIDNGKYDPINLANTQANLNSSQEWIVANATSTAGRSATHPLHIHVNPFLVVATAKITDAARTVINNTDSTQEQIYQALRDLKKEGDDRPGSAWELTDVAKNGIDPTIWWDTFPIGKDTAYKIQHRFDDYWGTYVLHCHVLIHEDQGMMWNVTVNNVDNKGANPCEQLLEPVVVSNNTFTTGTIIALQADTGKWLSRCNNCQQTVGNNYPDTITVHIDNPDSSNPYAQFEILDVGGGKIALKADTGKYVARCRNCIINGAYPDFLTVHVDDPSVPYAQFTTELLDNGKYALKADTGKYVARCRNCSTGAAYPDTVTIHVDDPAKAPYAQWKIKRIK